MMDSARFINLFRQDMVIIFRNGYVHVTLGLAILFVLLVHFALPEEMKVETHRYYVDHTAEKLITSWVISEGLDEFLLSTEAELKLVLEQNSQAVGIIFQGSRDKPQAILYQQGNESEKAIRGLEAAVFSLWNKAGDLGHSAVYRQVLLRPASEKPPFNLSLVPLLLAFESALIGLFFVIALTFQEKEEGSIRAYRISPAGTGLYITSKILSLMVLSVLSVFLLFVLTLGVRPELPAVLLLVVLVSLLVTAFGLTISVFFKTLSNTVFVLGAIMSVIYLPMISYFLPSFRAAFFPYIPTYPLMFGVRELIFSTGKTDFYIPMVLVLTVQIIIMLTIVGFAVERKLMKEGY